MSFAHQSLNDKPERRLQVYYDGACHLCSREIDHYRKKPGSALIEFIDITHPSFDPTAAGLEREAVNKIFHVKTMEGEVVTGVAGFIKIWEIIPSLGWLARLASCAPVNLLMRAGYRMFAEIRPLMPRRHCASGACHIKRQSKEG